MPGTITPAQMFDHELNATKGWPSPYAVDKQVERDSGVSGVNAGMCLYIDATSGKAKRGTIMGAMGLFAFQNENDFDVNGDVGNIISNHINTLVAVGAYELESTEFTGTGFNPNVPITSPTGGVNDGLLQATTLTGTTNIVGVVSDAGPLTNEYRKEVVRFWPVYLPVVS
jgi:hypothetical protein